MYVLNGKKITGPFTIGEGDSLVRYPANWLDHATKEQAEAVGILVVPDPERPDDRFYHVTENVDGSYASTDKDVGDVQAMLIVDVKQTASSRLAPTSWMVERFVDPSGGEPIPADVLEYRAAVRAASNSNELRIQALDNIADLSAFIPAWPDQN